MAKVLLVEEAGVALEGAVGGDGLEVEGGEFQLGSGEWGAGAHGCVERGESGPRLLKWCEWEGSDAATKPTSGARDADGSPA